MGYSKEHVEKTKRRILDHAGMLFRKHGYNGVGIDKIMNSAGLTRGGFYAHFKSKSELFKAVAGVDFDFTVQIKKMEHEKFGSIVNKALFAMKHYLGLETRNHIGQACTMASSAIDIAQSDKSTKLAFEKSFENLVSETQSIFRQDGKAVNRDQVIAALSTCVGGLILARACEAEGAERILNACRKELSAHFD